MITEKTNNKTIAKNTAFLYIRMMFTMGVSLYTSRVILQVLGVEDYGLYQSLGGIVGLLSFINGVLSIGSSRFLTYELGAGNSERLKRTFSTTLTIHIIIAALVVLLAETVGLWFLYHKMVIPAERMDTAVYVFHISIITSIFTLTQVPYNSALVAHERMSVFAYMSIVEVSAKLAVAYLLQVGEFDKLKLYATLLFVVQAGLKILYRLYCNRHFKETVYHFVFDKAIFKSIAAFSGWNLFSSISLALNSQGVLLLLNMFFMPTVVAARAISIQVNMAASQFVNSFRTAVVPQIVKKYASGEVEASRSLLLSSTKYSYYLMFVICFPICLQAYPLLKLWLGTVPLYTDIFLQLIVVQSLFQVFDTSFYTALYAKGQLRENALFSPFLGFLQFPVVYFLFKAGYSPVALSWASLIVYALLGMIVKPVLIVKIAGYRWVDIWQVYKACLLVTLTALPIPLILNHTLKINGLPGFFTKVIIAVVISALSVYLVGIDARTRKKIGVYLKTKLKYKK